MNGLPTPKPMLICVKTAVTILLCAVLLGGCVIPRHRAVMNEVPPPVAQQITAHFPSALYRLAAGDVLEFLFITFPTVTRAPYKITVGDELGIEFSFHPEMNRTAKVRPDGRISIPRKPDVSVAGKTSGEIKRVLTDVYSDLLKDPEITVSVKEFNSRLKELQKAVSTETDGQARQAAVRPDGAISLPLIEDMRVEGLTVPQVTKFVNDQYAKLIGDVKVSVQLREVVGNLIFVDGEVRKPGVFNVKAPTTVQQAIALAGGTKETAEPRSVLVVSKDPCGKFITRLTDLSKLSSCTDYVLKRNDLVYVPKSLIARADVWVDQNIKKLLLFDGWRLGLNAAAGRSTLLLR